ncbi:MAG: GNAT family N-acetyltransferase [Clostridia bacterium]|nr:GNAT family N-acetyltransferase [Clostridia bacterium]
MNEDILARNGSIALRRLSNDDSDIQLLYQWLSDPKVTAHVYAEGVPWTYEKVCAAFGRKVLAADSVTACLILRNDQAVGYLQFYPVRRDSYLCSADLIKKLRGAYGVDMFIGVPSLWRKGLGSAALRALEDCLRSRGAGKLCADPAADNEPGLRFWPKAGFEPLEVIEDYDDPSKQAILMMKQL